MYVKIVDENVDVYPYTENQLKRDNPNTTFPREISDRIYESYGVYPVGFAAMPSFDETTQYVENSQTPSLVDGQWTITRTVRSLSSDQLTSRNAAKAAENRQLRNNKLAETDHYGLSDVTMSAAMATYRQALRDITTHANWPHLAEDDWPTKP